MCQVPFPWRGFFPLSEYRRVYNAAQEESRLPWPAGWNNNWRHSDQIVPPPYPGRLVCPNSGWG